MRHILTAFFIAFAFGAIQPAYADKFMPTIYSDGFSCPNNCDAHVVFNPTHNGSKYASKPDSSRTSPKPCVVGSLCRICFDAGDDTCMEAVYRGGGPDKWRFDFTPAFYETQCGATSLPEVFSEQCKTFDKRYNKLTKDAVYCLSEPDHAGCPELIGRATAAKESDKPLWDECRALGEVQFNKKYQLEPGKQRSNACAYEMNGTGGPNSLNQRWRKLLPAACQPGAFVDRSGLDCCDSNKMSLGGMGRECSIYSVDRS